MAFELGIPVRLEDHPLQQLQTARMVAAVAVPTAADPNTIDEIRSDRRYAIYCNQMTDAAIQAALDKAKATGTPRVFWYCDAERWNTEAAAKWQRPGVIALIQAYRHKGEADADFKARIKAEYDRVTGLGWTAIVVLGVHRRQTAVNPPVYDLTERDVCHGVIVFSELQIANVIIFAEHRGDVPAVVVPYVDRLVSSVTALAQLPALVWPTPHPVPPDHPDPPEPEMPVMTDPERLALFAQLAPLLGPTRPHVTDMEQALHQANDGFRRASKDTYDGTPDQWLTVIDMRAAGRGSDADADTFAAACIRLRR